MTLGSRDVVLKSLVAATIATTISIARENYIKFRPGQVGVRRPVGGLHDF